MVSIKPKLCPVGLNVQPQVQSLRRRRWIENDDLQCCLTHAQRELIEPEYLLAGIEKLTTTEYSSTLPPVLTPGSAHTFRFEMAVQ